MEQTAAVELLVPRTRLGCTSWLSQQQPTVVADCLDLSQCAYNALRRELGKGEASRLSSEVARLQEQLLHAENLAKQQIAEAVSACQKEASRQLGIQKELCAQELAGEQKDKEERLALYRAREEALQVSLDKWQQEASGRERGLRERLGLQEAQLKEALDGQKVQLEEEHSGALASLKQLHQVELQELLDRCARTVAELQQTDQRHALRLAEERELLKEAAAQQLEQLRRESAQELAAKTLALEQQAQASERYWVEVQRLKQEIRDIYQKKSEEMKLLQEQHALQTKELVAERENLADKYLGSLRGSSTSALGQLGEDFVAKVQAELSLGTWRDTSHTASAGSADALWEMDFPGCAKLSALVEIKHAQRLHSVHDIAKFAEDVSAGARQGQINCAVLISLAARIPSTRPLHLSFEHGVPVLRASRNAEDALPARSLVELALSTVATVWPLIQRQRGEHSEEHLLCSISELFDAQLVEVAKLSKQADELERQGRSLQRSATQVRKCRDALAKGVDTIRIQFPQLVVGQSDSDEVESESIWTQPEAAALLELVQQFKTEHRGRYPKSFKELGALPDAVAQFVQMQQVPLPDAVGRAKALVPKGPKRPRTEPAAAAEYPPSASGAL